MPFGSHCQALDVGVPVIDNARLRRHGLRPQTTWREGWTDCWIRESLMLARLPALFLDRRRPRLAA